ncbi:hypothetical protein [Kitasatospora aburaviensis]|uniref:Uncharacterized protein n=1 Tax=Kitasatospora aburaviensis TaxID=67265 RepID=A0ABW1FBD5_9ACTN
MDIVVVLELDTPTNVRVLQPDRTPAEPEKAVRRAHTAPAEASGLCGPLTLCGLDTSEMTLAPHLSARDRQRWHTCSTCRTTGGRTGGGTGGSADGGTGGSPDGGTAPGTPAGSTPAPGTPEDGTRPPEASAP